MDNDHRLRVGIDFGTTFSGVSWVYTAKPDEVAVIKEWPGGARSSEKVPSEISYNSAGQVHKWGFEIKASDERLAWIKLLLEPTKYSGSQSSTINRTKSLIPTQRRKEPVNVVTDYLTCLRKHTIATLKRKYGQAFLDVTPIDYILTVPAIWSDLAKELTLQAAESAGFGDRLTVELMSEPDAAAAWTLLQELKLTTLKAHDAFVVVDCGGGTVDLISYEVLTTNPSLRVKECAIGTGSLCGSTFLNENFEQLVKSRIGERYDKMKTLPRNKMMKEFEEVLKRSFSNSEDDDVFSCAIGGVADDPAAGVEDGGFIISREEMQDIFDPVIDQIILLVQEQMSMVEAKPSLNLSAILLVGGFGASNYLLQRLENELKRGGRNSGKPLEILQPLNAWSAVARGAALGIRISSRTARRHYGVSCTRPFIFGKHPIKNLFYSRYTGDAECDYCMRWYIKRGDQVSEETPISIPFYHNLRVDGPLEVTNILYECEENTAPKYLNENRSSIKELCTFVSDLSTVPKHLLTKKIGHNLVPYYEVRYNLVVTVKSAMLIAFHLEFNGEKYKNGVTAKYRND